MKMFLVTIFIANGNLGMIEEMPPMEFNNSAQCTAFEESFEEELNYNMKEEIQQKHPNFKYDYADVHCLYAMNKDEAIRMAFVNTKKKM